MSALRPATLSDLFPRMFESSQPVWWAFSAEEYMNYNALEKLYFFEWRLRGYERNP